MAIDMMSMCGYQTFRTPTSNFDRLDTFLNNYRHKAIIVGRVRSDLLNEIATKH